MSRTALVAALVLGGCAPAQLVSRSQAAPNGASERIAVVLEPFFENAEVSYVRDLAPVAAPDRAAGSTRQWVEVERPVKPLLAQADALADEHRRAVDAIRRLRPAWQVESTTQLPRLQGPVVLVRTVVGQSLPPKSADRWFICALPFLWGFRIAEVQTVQAVVDRFAVDGEQLKDRILRYPAQPDFQVDTEGLPKASAAVAFDLEYLEQVFTDPKTRAEPLVAGFSEALAAKVVSLVESTGQ